MREVLEISKSMNDPDNNKNKKGILITPVVGVVLSILVLAIICATGLLVFYFVSCDSPYSRLLAEDQESEGIDARSKYNINVRLPTHLKPVHYKVMLIPFLDPGNFTIRGRVWIDLECLSESSNVTVHGRNLTVGGDAFSLTDVESSAEIKVNGHSYDKDREFYIVDLGSTLRVGGKYRLHVTFIAELNDLLKGFYRSSYTDKRTNETRWLASTQFEATEARRSFPCLDEPAMKATFEISLGRKISMSSISNMPIERSEPIPDLPGYVWDHFMKSVPMPTYLVAFVVSDFEKIVSPPGVTDTKFRVWARKDAISQGRYSSEIGPKVLNFFNSYFNVHYPLPKLDMIALPDFGPGAMENWGLVTYRETALLHNETEETVGHKYYIASTICHELAHNWFGNLVSMTWWDMVWLNEGLTTYFDVFGLERVEPDMASLDQFVVNSLQGVMETDSLTSSHPISVTVNHPDEISEIFDAISYLKGAAIVRMLNHFLGESTFRNGLTNYLNGMAYSNAEQDDLWRFLTDQAHTDGTLPQGVDIKTIMDTWTLQMGYPVITVTRNYQSGMAVLTQEHFLMKRNATQSDDHEYRWWVPITFTRRFDTNFDDTLPVEWMKSSDYSIDVRTKAHLNEWVIFNIQETGYYRVNYDHKNWQLLTEQLLMDHEAIHLINRAQLIDDSLGLAMAGQLGYDVALGITKYLKKEKLYIPWQALFNNINYIEEMFRRTPQFGVYKKYMSQLIRPHFKKIGMNRRSGETHMDTYLRAMLVSWACGLDMEECVGEATREFLQWMRSGVNKIDPNIKRTVYCTAIKHGGQRQWQFAWDQYVASNVGTEKYNLLRSLACTREADLLGRMLEWSVTKNSGVRKQDGTYVYAWVSRNMVGRYLAFDFVRNRWEDIKKYYSKMKSTFISAVAHSMNTELDLKQMRELSKTHAHDLGSAKRAMRQSLESIEVNIAWMKDNFQTVLSWLEKNS